jgi:hypothetical protein
VTKKEQTKQQAIRRFIDFEKSDEAVALDPEEAFIWQGVAAGYFLGLGFSPTEAYEMSLTYYSRS